jgi:hypothetical protein
MSATAPAARRHDGDEAYAGRGVIRRLSTETKAAFKTTEFYAYLLVLAGILIAGDNIGGGGLDHFRANSVWLYATILTVGYMVSRGLAKAGSREPYTQEDRT